MNELYIGVVVVTATLFAIFLSRLTFFKGRMPYGHRHILTKTEYAFWKTLQLKTRQYDLLICPKVRMEDFLSVKVKSERQRQAWRGKVKSRHIDFILCDKDMNMIAGIELDDNSHKYNKETIQSDKFKNRVFEAIGYPLFRIIVSKGNYAAQIDEMLNSLHCLKLDGRVGDDT